MNSFLLSILAFLFAIGVLVAVHEWGHYIVARMAGVKVLRFSIGFGKPLWMVRAGADQTEYCLSAIPLGGYVKLLDEREGEVDPAEVGRSFNRAPVSSRIAILIAGPLMNFVFAVAAYWLMFSIGVPGLQPVIGEIQPYSVAAEAGLRPEDRITAIGSEPIATWEGAVLALLDEMLSQDQVRLDVTGVDGADRTVYLDLAGKIPELTEPGQLFNGLGLEPWSPTIPPVLGEIVSGGAAEAAGLESGDLIVSAAGTVQEDWGSWVNFIRERPGQLVVLVVERAGQTIELDLSIGEFTEDSGAVIGRIGAGPFVPDGFYDSYTEYQRYRIFPAFLVGVERTWLMSVLTVRMVGRIVTGDVSMKNISGPINIAQYAGYSAAGGLSSFLNFLAVVSLSLGILNLLPIPVLDGGQVLYQVLEYLKGAPLSDRAQIIGQQIGIAFLVLLMGFAFYNDLSRVFS
jgi:regulator of sigma E protease